MDLIGVSLFDRPSAAVLVRDGRVLAGARESDFSRIPGDRAFPGQALEHCLRLAKIGPVQLTEIIVAGRPEDPVPESAAYPAAAARGTSLRSRMKRWLGARDTWASVLAAELDPAVKVSGLDPDRALAAGAFLGSSFGHAAGLLIRDGSVRAFRGNDIDVEFLAETMDGSVADAARSALSAVEAEALVLAGSGDGRRTAALLSRELGVPVFAGPGGEAAAALGAALDAARQAGHAGTGDPVTVPGPGYNTAQIRTFLRSQSATAEELDRDETGSAAAAALAAGGRILWFDGRSEMDDDAPAARSILRLPDDAPPGPGERDVDDAGASRPFRDLLGALAAAGRPAVIRSAPLRRPGETAAATPPAAWEVWKSDESLTSAFFGVFRLDRPVP